MKLLFAFAIIFIFYFSAIQAKKKDVGDPMKNSRKIQDESSLLTNKKRGTKQNTKRNKKNEIKRNKKNKNMGRNRIQKKKNKKSRSRGRKSRNRQRITCRQEPGNSTAWETCLEHSITSMRRYKEVVANFRDNLTQIV